MSSEEKFEIWLAENRGRLSKLNNPHLAIFQRSGEIDCIDHQDELASKVTHHLAKLERIITEHYRGLYEPLTREGKLRYGNERFRMKSVRRCHLHVKTRLEPCLRRDDGQAYPFVGPVLAWSFITMLYGVIICYFLTNIGGKDRLTIKEATYMDWHVIESYIFLTLMIFPPLALLELFQIYS